MPIMTSVYKLSAFSKDNRGGNPAGVYLQADQLSKDEMQKIAFNVGFSETAFVSQSNIGDYRVRFFTPVDEVDLCGHATIATFNLLRMLKVLEVGTYTQETNAGLLEVEVKKDAVFMTQNPPIFYQSIVKSEILDCFEGLGEHDIMSTPIQVVSTGLKDIILPIRSLSALEDCRPNFKVISALSQRHDAVGIHAFCLESYRGGDAYVRNFAPLFGIDEEAATGTSNGALASYLNRYISPAKVNYRFEQGYGLGSPSEILVNLTLNEFGGVKVVSVGGSAYQL